MFVKRHLRNFLKLQMGNKAAPDFSMYETNSDSTGRRDWVSEWEARLSKGMKYDVMGLAKNLF